MATSNFPTSSQGTEGIRRPQGLRIIPTHCHQVAETEKKNQESDRRKHVHLARESIAIRAVLRLTTEPIAIKEVLHHASGPIAINEVLHHATGPTTIKEELLLATEAIAIKEIQ